VKVPKRNIVPLSVNEVSRFWSSFRTARDLAIVGLMASARAAVRRSIGFESGRPLCFPKPSFAFMAKATNFASCRWRQKPCNCFEHYLRLDDDPCSAALFVSLKDACASSHDPAGLRVLISLPSQTTSINLAKPPSLFDTPLLRDMIRAG